MTCSCKRRVSPSTRSRARNTRPNGLSQTQRRAQKDRCTAPTTWRLHRNYKIAKPSSSWQVSPRAQKCGWAFSRLSLLPCCVRCHIWNPPCEQTGSEPAVRRKLVTLREQSAQSAPALLCASNVRSRANSGVVRPRGQSRGSDLDGSRRLPPTTLHTQSIRIAANARASRCRMHRKCPTAHVWEKPQ